jgi:outer membrane protein assembly factor BamA
MTKVRPYIAILCLMHLHLCLYAQNSFELRVIPVDSTAKSWLPKISPTFKTAAARLAYVQDIPNQFYQAGFAAASIDQVRIDSNVMTISLYGGKRWTLGEIAMTDVQQKQIEAAGIPMRSLNQKNWNWQSWEKWQSLYLDYMENHGYPFASIRIDSIQLVSAAEGVDQGEMRGILKLEPGPLYKLDSIHAEGNLRISSGFLHRYLGILPGSIYQREKLAEISNRLRELPYLAEIQPWSLTMLGTGAHVNLFLESKKASQVNVLVGLLPSNEQLTNQGLLITGEANILLRNTLGVGETFLLNWQQLQVRSPRLQFEYQQPFIGGSAFGVQTAFNLLKKDSLWLNVDLQLGTQYAFSARQTGSIYFKRFSSNLLSVDTAFIRSTKKLPDILDLTLTSVGLDVEQQHTNYRFNPRSGYHYSVSLLAGTRVIRENNVITDMKDPNFDFSQLYDTVPKQVYQFRWKGQVAGYWPIGRSSTIKTALHTGWLQSSTLYRNELFQIGGFRLLRGFDEESIFASLYVCPTLEYRYLLAKNSYFFSFVDAGYVQNRTGPERLDNVYLGIGAGLNFETKAGMINMSLAAGKRDDLPFNLRQTKVHIGFLSYF